VGPRDHTLERRPSNANQVPDILATEVRLKIAAICVNVRHSLGTILIFV